MGTDTIKEIILFVIVQSGVIGAVSAAVMAKFKKERVKGAALYKGMQAILRHELYSLYTEYKCQKGFAPVYVKEDFENMYKWYHELGGNGVMNGIHDEFQKLPTQEADENE